MAGASGHTERPLRVVAGGAGRDGRGLHSPALGGTAWAKQSPASGTAISRESAGTWQRDTLQPGPLGSLPGGGEQIDFPDRGHSKGPPVDGGDA